MLRHPFIASRFNGPISAFPRRSLATLLLVAVSLLIRSPVHAQDEAAAGGVSLGQAKTQRWQVGLMITAADGACLGTFATVPIPGNWPEQAVREVGREVSPHVTGIEFRALSGTGKPIRPDKRNNAVKQNDGVTQLLVSTAPTIFRSSPFGLYFRGKAKAGASNKRCSLAYPRDPRNQSLWIEARLGVCAVAPVTDNEAGSGGGAVSLTLLALVEGADPGGWPVNLARMSRVRTWTWEAMSKPNVLKRLNNSRFVVVSH